MLAVAGLLAAGHARAQTQAADLVVMTSGAMSEAVQLAGADYTKATGRKVTYVVGTTSVVQGKIHGGQAFDVVAVTADGVEQLYKEGLVGPAAPAPLAKAVLGVAVKAGAAKPDISTVDAFKAAMLSAKSVSYPDPVTAAAAGAYVKALFQKLGIADQMAGKTLLEPMGALAAAAVAKGQAELAVTFVSEMAPNKDVQVIGLLPDAIQNPTPFAIGAAAHSADPAGAKAFIAFVTSAKEGARLREAGLQPAG
jgi:molybdate transport system substrate-binding protein